MTSKQSTADGHLNKSIIKEYIEFGCERQLFWNMARGDARWMTPARPPRHSRGGAREPELLLQMGRDYEQDVYARLLNSAIDVRFVMGSHDRVVSRRFDPDHLGDLHDELRASREDGILLLEHEWRTPPQLLRWILDLEPSDVVPIANPSLFCRPDLMMLVDRAGAPDRSLSGGGRIDAVPASDQRVAIRMLDVKHTNPEDIGKKQFIELLFYAHSMAFYLEEHGLTDRFFVSLDGCGIWPARNLNRIKLRHPRDLYDTIVEMSWDNHSHLFTKAVHVIRELHGSTPIAVEDVDLVIQPACARCRYVEDCKATLGWSDKLADLSNVDVRLLPGTSSATAEQLRDLQIDTVEQLEAQLDTIQLDTLIPSPLYAERELLKLKARAMIAGEPVLPDNTRDERRHLSMAMPQYSGIVLTFNAEADPTNDCVFAFGAHLDIRCSEDSPYGHAHDRWWKAWKGALKKYRRYQDIKTRRVLDTIVNPDLIDHFIRDSDGLTREQVITRILTRINLFMELLWEMNRHGALEIIDDHEHQARIVVRYTYSFVSQGLAPHQERALANQMVRQFQAMVSLSSIYEELVGEVSSSNYNEGGTWIQAPQSAVFYWSRDQLQHIQELMERHLTELMTDPDICVEFNQLLQLINPAESEVERDYLHKKLYDLRVFVETCVGIPQIINYTWHEIATSELSYGPKFSSKYWAANFNYMDFLAWHQYLASQDASEARPLLDESGRKATVIAQLARLFQGRARRSEILPSISRPVPTNKIPWRAGLVRPEYHFLARVWALYAKLTVSVQAQQALSTRLDYPDYAIGKLAAATVTDLVGREDAEGKQLFRFTLTGVSSNMKLSEGDYVLLVHEDGRDQQLGSRSGENIIIDEMTWQPEKHRYVILAHARSAKHPYFSDEPRGDGDWYLYPAASDYWCNKLFESPKDNIFKRYDLGTSWLGTRAAYLLDLLPAGESVPTRQRGYSFSTPELYALAPRLLPSREPEPDNIPLRTTCYPSPDPSQRRAIKTALASTVSCIQGPPGTGKSQTIAALVDEFLERNAGRPVKILVASFSYVPLRVVAEKICDHHTASNTPTLAANTQKVFLRSPSRDAFDLPGVHDLYRSGSTLYLDGKTVERKRDKGAKGGYRRLEDYLDESFILFGTAQQLFNLGKPTGKASNYYHFLHSDFAFDLIIVDEASQMPVDQALTSLCLVRRGEATLELPGDYDGKERIEDRDHLERMEIASLVDYTGAPLADEALTRVVIVGDHNQLPPVQPVEISEKLRPILGSMFEYYVRYQGVPSQQLSVNYRSRPEIVGYTRHLGLYDEEIQAFHSGANAYKPLPAVPSSVDAWMRDVLADDRVVSALVHDQQYETAISPLEASLVAQLVEAYFAQMGIASAQQERDFWREHIGIVAPHNAQGRLIIRSIAEKMSSGAIKSTLDGAELEELLRSTIYTVEKFQGSARTFIIASMGISARDQLAAEETFIYDMNRLNVLTSRAKQKMLMICSREFLEYTPRHREVVAAAARSRDFAMVYCNQKLGVSLKDGDGRHRFVELRWHDPNARLATVPRPARPKQRADAGAPAAFTPAQEAMLRAALGAIGVDFDALTPQELATFAAQVLSMQQRHQ